MNAMRTFRTMWLPLIGTALLLHGCAADKLTRENFSQIRQSVSTRPLVVEIIGEPSQQFDNRWSYERPNDHLTVFIDFDESGYVSRKQWIDAMSATWDDTKSDDPNKSTRESTYIQNDRP